MDDWTEAERFLLTTYDCLMEHPRDLVSPSEVGIRLGLEYERVGEILDELQQAELLRRTGSRRVLSDARILVTDEGFRAIRALDARRDFR